MDKDANVDYTMKDQVIFNSTRSHCEELNDEAIQLRFLTDPSLLLRTWFGMTARGCHCEENYFERSVREMEIKGNDEAIQYNMSFRAEREILALNEVKNLRSLTRVRDDKWFNSYYLFSRFAPSG